jgi:hypothetical protein
MTADNSYLGQLPMSGQAQMQNQVPVVMWDYWFNNNGGGAQTCDVSANSHGAITTWKGIETANSGGSPN